MRIYLVPEYVESCVNKESTLFVGWFMLCALRSQIYGKCNVSNAKVSISLRGRGRQARGGSGDWFRVFRHFVKWWNGEGEGKLIDMRVCVGSAIDMLRC